MAANPDELDLDLATAVYEDMEAMVKEEIYLRIDLKAKVGDNNMVLYLLSLSFFCLLLAQGWNASKHGFDFVVRV